LGSDGGEAGSSAALRNDSQKNKGKGKGRSRFPEGMTERKARATAKAAEKLKTEK
jgi:hypothetical protein